MKRFLIDTSVENAEGTQTWFVDAETEQEALNKFSSGTCDLYESNVEVLRCGEPEISGVVPLDDFGQFAEQPPAAQPAPVHITRYELLKMAQAAGLEEEFIVDPLSEQRFRTFAQLAVQAIAGPAPPAQPAPVHQGQLAEADRRAGAAERELETCRSDLARINRVRDKMKDEWGVDRNVSFDVVWAEALKLKRQATPSAAQTAVPTPEDQIDAVRWRWLSWHTKVAWDEGKFTSLLRIVSDENRRMLNASIDRMMAGDWSDADKHNASIIQIGKDD